MHTVTASTAAPSSPVGFYLLRTLKIPPPQSELKMNNQPSLSREKSFFLNITSRMSLSLRPPAWRWHGNTWTRYKEKSILYFTYPTHQAGLRSQGHPTCRPSLSITNTKSKELWPTLSHADFTKPTYLSTFPQHHLHHLTQGTLRGRAAPSPKPPRPRHLLAQYLSILPLSIAATWQSR